MTDNLRNGDDRIETHYRQQLSALMDGNLSPDEARFLLRRLQHDTGLADCWERWQMAGEALRGRALAPLPADFSQRVAASIAAEPVPARVASVATPRWLRWGGGAVAASVALVALFITQQQSPLETVPDPGASSRAVAEAPVPAPVRRQATPLQPAVDPNTAAAMAAVAAVAMEAPRRAAGNNRNGAQSQVSRVSRASTRSVADQSAATVVASVTPAAATATARLAAAATAASSRTSDDPFASLPIAPARPWPRATLPQLPATTGVFQAGYSGMDSYYPFEPRMPVPSRTDDVAPATQETP